MCTLALYYKMITGYPLFTAANRDEHYDRPSSPPALLDTDPSIVAGRDLRAGGTWLGVNEHGLLVAILNRRSLVAHAPPPAIRSRGLLCLDLLRSTSAAEARLFLTSHRTTYQPFTLLIADVVGAWGAYNDRDQIKLQEFEPGLHVFSSTADSDMRSAKTDRVHKKFLHIVEDLNKDAAVGADWVQRIQSVLSDHQIDKESRDRQDAVCVHGDVSGTVSSSVVAYSAADRCFRTFYCSGAPCQNRFYEATSLSLR